MFICTSYNILFLLVTKRLSCLRGFDDTSHSKKGFVGTIQENTAISRKAVGINVHSTIPKGNMGYDQYTVPDTVAVEICWDTSREYSYFEKGCRNKCALDNPER